MIEDLKEMCNFCKHKTTRKINRINEYICGHPKEIGSRIIDLAIMPGWCHLTDEEKKALSLRGTSKTDPDEIIKELGF